MFGSKKKSYKSRFYEKERYQAETFMAQFVVLVDRSTGVNYLASTHGTHPDCITPLYGADGKLIVDKVDVSE